jgi:hypothetical protein
MRFIIPLLFVTGLLAGAEPPEAIRSYYDRAAFLATYSTQAERAASASYINRRHKFGVKPEGIRFGKIAEAQTLNAQMILRVDPEMPLGPKLTQTSQGYVALAEIVECAVTETTVTLKLRSHELSSTAIARYSVHYDQVAGDPVKLPTLDERLALTGAKTSPVIIHQWVLTPDGWRKKEADWMLLNR